MVANLISILLLADFNVQNLAVLLQKNANSYEINCVCAPFGQTVNLLLDTKAEFWSAPHDAVVLWTAPERAVPSFSKVLSFEEYSVEELLKEVDPFAALLERISDTVRAILVPSWIVPGIGRGWGPLDLTNGIGVANALMRMNIRLADVLGHNRRVVLLDSQRWITAAGAGAYNPKLWYLSKTPFHTAVFQEASRDILAVLDGVSGRSKKIVILDLDNTMWGGIVGEIGWEKLRLGGHDPVGEAFVDFQKALKRLMNRGVILALVSKNEESVALEAIDQNPEMILRRHDFVGWRINWRDKAQNIVELLSELNLGLESAVFLDDSPFERNRVRDALPQVLVPDLPPDPLHYSLFLSRLRCFDNPFVSSEDRSRTKMYVADRGRTELKNEIASLKEWLAKLELGIAVEPLSDENLERAAQLFNKTNQMNLSTRRLSATELFSWAQREGHTLWTFRVWDRFGDYGLCGISSLVRNSATGQIVDFLLSCRVMGRGVEDAMLAAVMQHAKDVGCGSVCAEYIPSAKNQPCRKWLQNLPGADMEANRFVFSSKNAVAFPPHIRISFCEADEKVSV
jgi:FkbH-like protein